MDHVSTDFIDVRFDKENDTLISTWQPATENATGEDIRSGFMDYFIKMVLEHSPKRLINDEREMHRPYSPEEQAHIDKNSAPVVLNSSVEKIGIVISHDGFVELSSETMMEEEVAKGLNAKYFETFDEAKKWILE
jgi:hypothetical protein